MSLPLADAVFWAAVVCCAVAQWLILRGALATPATPAAGAAVPAARWRSEVAWALVPAVGLALTLAATWRALHPPPAAPTPAAETVVLRRAAP